jgi:toxin CcdB
VHQFDVFQNPSPSSASFAPFLVVIQSHHLRPLDRTIVAPLGRDALKPVSDLGVSVEVAGETLVVAITEIAAIEQATLRRRISSIAHLEDEIRRALDRSSPASDPCASRPPLHGHRAKSARVPPATAAVDLHRRVARPREQPRQDAGSGHYRPGKLEARTRWETSST